MAAVAMAVLAASASHAETWVITDQAHPISGKTDRHVLLDDPARLNAELASGVPANPMQAAVLVQQRLNQGSADLQRRIGAAYQGVADAWGLGITKIPAVVVDRRYVVYGEPDVARAVSRINAYRGARP
ncbi:TIGR03757 family integrating conjugative element protein [Variovorax sp. LARHSF232]